METTLQKITYRINGKPVVIVETPEYQERYTGMQAHQYQKVAFYAIENYPYSQVIFEYVNGATAIFVTGRALREGFEDLKGEKFITSVLSLPIERFVLELEENEDCFTGTFSMKG